MGYARADSRSRLRRRAGRGRTQRTIIMLAVYGVTIAFGLSGKSGTFSSDDNGDRRHDSDAGPSDRTVPPAPTPNVWIAMPVPIVDVTCDGLSYLVPGSKEAPLDGQVLLRLPLRVDGKVWRRTRRWPETSLRDWPTRPRHQRCIPGVRRNGRAGG
jgi:hypothetical protein